MSTKRIIIIEDEIIIAENTKAMLDSIGYAVVGHAMNLADASTLIEKENFDLALVDLMLGNKKDGVEVARLLKNKKKPFIITSSYSDKETIEEIKELKPSGYIVKPIQEQDLYAAIEIIPIAGDDGDTLNLMNESLFYRDKDLFIRIHTEEIEHIKSDGNYIEVYTKNKKHLLRYSLDNLLTKLPSNFIRVHRSHAINSNCITAINSVYISIGETKVPLGKTYRQDFLKKIDVL